MTRAEFEQALSRYQGPLLRYAGRLLGAETPAQDAVQECFLRLVRVRRAPPAHLTQWLYSVCRNLCIDHLRKEGRMSTLDGTELNERAGDQPAPLERVEKREAADRLAASIDRLTPRQQEVLHLRFQEGLSYRQIGAVTDASVSHVGVLLHTALKTLRREMGEEPGAARGRTAS